MIAVLSLDVFQKFLLIEFSCTQVQLLWLNVGEWRKPEFDAQLGKFKKLAFIEFYSAKPLSKVRTYNCSPCASTDKSDVPQKLFLIFETNLLCIWL